MTSDALPLIDIASGNSTIAWYKGQAISRHRLLADAFDTAAQLPDRPHVINLCLDRYHFMVAFAAALLRGQLTLLPPTRAPEVVEEIGKEYDAYGLCDIPIEELHLPTHNLCLEKNATQRPPAKISSTQPAVLAFTSGSTGRAQPYGKTWGQLVTGTRLALRRFGMDDAAHHLLATVPPQHMYGLESTVLYAMLGPNSIHAGLPFYPEDIRLSLEELPSSRVLVTTPLHLRALTRANLKWPTISFMLCATAPLDGTLATQAERTFSAPLHEIYGFTEAGAVASREPLRDPCWRLYDGMRFSKSGEDWQIVGPQLDRAQVLTDRIETKDGEHFALLGRKSELLNIAGKRTTIGELNHRLLSIPGVIDGCFVQPDPARERLAALVVAPDLDEEFLMRVLARSIDPVFLPRPLIKLEALPRTDTGKLPNNAVLALLDSAGLSA